MGNKQSLQLNNEELQAVLNTIKSLPSAKKWMGGGTIIPGTKDVLIPAFTDMGLTVQGDTNLKAENIKSGVEIFGVIGSMPSYQLTFGEVNTTGDYRGEVLRIPHGLDNAPTHYGVNGSFPRVVATVGDQYPSIKVSVDSSYIIISVPRMNETTLNWVAIAES